MRTRASRSARRAPNAAAVRARSASVRSSGGGRGGAASVTDQHATRLPWRGVRTQQRPAARTPALSEGTPRARTRARAARRRSARRPRRRTSARWSAPTARRARPAEQRARRSATSSTRRCRPATSATCRPRTADRVRRFMRDSVDARWNLGEFFLPVAVVFLIVVQLALAKTGRRRLRHPRAVRRTSSRSSIDAFLLWRGLKKRLRGQVRRRRPAQGRADVHRPAGVPDPPRRACPSRRSSTGQRPG